MNRAHSTRVLLGFILALAPGFLVGCGSITVRPPSSTQAELGRAGRASVVLMRLQVSFQGKTVRTPEGYSIFAAPGGKRFWLRLADLEASAPVHDVYDAHSPSEEARDAGWIYLELPAGNYWLSLVPSGVIADATPPTMFSTVPPIQGHYGLHVRGEFQPVPAFRLDVREGEPVLYAGTIELSKDLRLSSDSDPGAGGETPVVTVRILDQREAAARVIRNDLASRGLDTIQTRLLQDYHQSLGAEEIHELTPFGLASLSSEHLGNPEWIKRSLGLWLTPTGVLLSAAGGGGSGSGALVALGIAYVPIGTLGGLIHGTVTRGKWKHTLQALDDELAEMKPNLELAAVLKTNFVHHLHRVPIDLTPEEIVGSDGPDAPTATSVHGMILATITRIVLRESGEGGKFLVEVGIRIRLWDTREKHWRYDRAFVYTEFNPEKRITLERPYETLLLASSPGRPMDAYAGPEGRAQLRLEVRRAIQLVVEEVRHDWGLEEWLREGE